jgi:hypothetical protein
MGHFVKRAIGFYVGRQKIVKNNIVSKGHHFLLSKDDRVVLVCLL